MIRKHYILACGAGAAGLLGGTVQAQTASTSLPASSAPEAQQVSNLPANHENDGDIIVTARKRNESSIAVPISIQAFGARELAQYNTKSMEDLAKQVPGFVLQTNQNPAATVYLRGVGSVPQNSTGEQSVGFVLDGVATGGSGVLRSGQIDVSEVEVLKGPQPLFFGKNTTAGVVSFRTADPADHSEASVVAGYGFENREKTLQGVISGPITENLGIRAVGYINYSQGYFKNNAAIIPGNLATLGPPHARGAYRKEQLFRLTGLYTPTDNLSIRAKYTFDNAHQGGALDSTQRFYCPNGVPQDLGLMVPDSCKADRYAPNGRFVPAIVSQYPGQYPYQGLRFRQHLGIVNVKYDIADDISLTSDTGYYRYHEGHFQNAAALSVPLLYGGARLRRRNFTEELRLTTSKTDWPVNFTVGGFYENRKEVYQSFAVLDQFLLGLASRPGLAGGGNQTKGIYYPMSRTYSGFLQATWGITNRLELAGGARYSHENKKITITDDNGVFVPNARPALQSSNVSPEVTLTFRPTNRLTFYTGYRQGYKSGGFNTSPGGSLSTDRSFRPERAEGVEVGVKARVDDFRFNLNAYHYTYRDLQVSRFDNVLVSFTIQNAARSRVQGIEGDFDWRPASLAGIGLHGAFNYNKAQYTDFVGACYVGQTIAEGCNQVPGATGRFTSQSLNGAPIINAPVWTGNLGLGYNQEAGGLKYGGSVDGYYSSAYFAQFEEAPGGKQGKSLQINASVRIGAADDKWQLAFIGKNLTNIYRAFLVSQPVGTGKSALTGTNTPGGRADLSSIFEPGRQFQVQLTTKF